MGTIMKTAKTLVRLCKCPGFSEFSLGDRDHTLYIRFSYLGCCQFGLPMQENRTLLYFNNKGTDVTHSGKSATIRESNHSSGVCEEHYA